jgi:DNA-binding beta-propeller fold protein YncE
MMQAMSHDSRRTITRILAATMVTLVLASGAHALDRSLFVINSLAETLSRVDLQTGVVSNNITTLGLAPNQIFIDNEGRRDSLAYITNSTSSDLQIVSLFAGTTVKTISLDPGRNPYSLTFIDDSIVVVTNLLTGTLSEVDTKNDSVLVEYPVGKSPEGIVYHDGLLYVCLTAFDFGTFLYGQGRVAVVDPVLHAVIDTIDVGMNPQAALIDYEGDLLVLCTGDFFSVFGQIYVIDPDTRQVTDSIAAGGSPGHFALAPDGTAYIAAGGFVGHGEVYTFDTHTHTMLRGANNPVHVGIGAVAVDAEVAGFAYSCDFSADRVSKVYGDSVLGSYPLGDGPGFAAVYEPYPPGDVNQTGDVQAADIIFLINYIFRSAPPPALLSLGDVNRSCTISASDVIALVNFVFKSGPRLRYGCY